MVGVFDELYSIVGIYECDLFDMCLFYVWCFEFYIGNEVVIFVNLI